MSQTLHTRLVVRLLIADNSSVLFAKVIKKGFYFLPGGGIDYNEPLQTAAIRELQEEIGVSPEHVRKIVPLGVFEHSWPDNGLPMHELNVVCLCEVSTLKSSKPVKSKEDHLDFEWIDIEDLRAKDIRPENFKALIPSWFKQQEASGAFYATSMR